MITVRGETYTFERIARKENSPYEWEEIVDVVFRGRPANTMEINNYRIQSGLEGNNETIYIISSNLPESIKIGDKINFMGKVWTVRSVGYYFDSNRLINAKIMSDKYIQDHSPKGISLS